MSRLALSRLALAGMAFALSSLAASAQEQTEAQRLAFRCNYAASERGFAIDGAPRADFVRKCIEEGQAAMKDGKPAEGAPPAGKAP